jgi:transposase
MPAKPKFDRTKMLKLHRQGLSQQEIADRLGCNQKTVSQALREVEREGEKLRPTRRGRPRKAVAGEVRQRVIPETNDEPLGFDEAELLGLSGHEAGQRIFGVYGTQYLPALRRRIRPLILSAESTTEMQLLAKLVEIEGRIEKELLAAIPPRPPDPAEDPANVGARDRVRAELERLALMRRQRVDSALRSAGMHAAADMVTGLL